MSTLLGIVLLVIVLALIGFLVYIVVDNIPMPKLFQQVISVAVAVYIVVYLIGILMGYAPLPSLPIFK